MDCFFNFNSTFQDQYKVWRDVFAWITSANWEVCEEAAALTVLTAVYLLPVIDYHKPMSNTGIWIQKADRGKNKMPSFRFWITPAAFKIFWGHWKTPAEYWNMQHYIFPGAALDMAFPFSDKKPDSLWPLWWRDPRSWELWVQITQTVERLHVGSWCGGCLLCL